MIQITTQKDSQQSTVTADDMARYKKQLDIMKAATKKYQKLPTNAAAATKYKMKMTAYADKMKIVNKQIRHVKKAKQTVKTKKTLSALNKKLSKYKKEYNRAKSNYAIKNKASKTDKMKSKVLSNIKKSKLFNERAYIMPNNPKTDNSFVFVFVSDEATSHGNTPATQPVEHGTNIATTTQMNTPTMSITGTIGGDSEATISKLNKEIEKLELWADSGADLRWHGQRQINHVILSDISSDINTSSGGTGINTVNVTFTLTIATYFDSNPHKKKSKTKNTGTKNTTKGNKGSKKNNSDSKAKAHKYIVAKRGYTYWYVAQKTGVKLSIIEKLNNYPNRQVPIGAKIYYS